MKARDNPFATDRVEHLLRFRPEWLGTDWNSIDQQWLNLSRRAALTGRHGAGKTTFLDTWAMRLNETGHQVTRLFLNRANRSLSREQWQSLKQLRRTTVFLDGEEQLTWKDRRKFYHLTQSADGLLVTRHSKGKLPTLLHIEPSIEILDRCVQYLAPDHHAQLATQFPEWWQQSKGNIREVLLKCFDAVRKPG